MELTSLQSQGTVVVDAVSANRDDFFLDGYNGITNIELGDNFKNLFLPLVSTIINYIGGKIEKFKLTKSFGEFEIKRENHDVLLIQTPDIIAAQIIVMITHQPDGEIGELAVDGKTNVWYYLDDENCLCCVRVLWNTKKHKWHFSIGIRYSSERGGVGLVFSPEIPKAMNA